MTLLSSAAGRSRCSPDTTLPELPWRDLGVDLVLECTGAFRREEDLTKHLAAGARRVILSAPARTETVATVVHGVNHAPPG